MRKVIAVLIMASAIGAYAVHVMNVGETRKIAAKNEDKIKTQIEGCRQELDSNYPAEPAAIMEIYDKLLQLGYSGRMSEEEADEYVKTVRLMYSDAFNELNPEAKQKSALLCDLDNNKENEIDVVASSIQTVYILEDDNGEQTQASVTVQHATNKSSVLRKYLFIKEDGKWKINGWQSVDQ